MCESKLLSFSKILKSPSNRLFATLLRNSAWFGAKWVSEAGRTPSWGFVTQQLRGTTRHCLYIMMYRYAVILFNVHGSFSFSGYATEPAIRIFRKKKFQKEAKF